MAFYDRWPLKRGSNDMKFSMTGQEKGDLLIQVTALAGLTEQRVFKPVPVELLTSSTAML